MLKIDLHMHSNVSDGDKSPSVLMELAHNRELGVLSLTDHDCACGIGEAKKRARELGMEFISGIELSCYDKKDTHILGYNIDWQDSLLNSTLEAIQNSRVERMEKMVEGLRKDGFDISIDEVNAKCNGQVMGRPHIAAVLVEKGYGEDSRDVFNKYIGSGCRYYVPYKKLGVQEGIDLIHKAGGKAVLAHPKLLRYNSRDFSRLLRNYKNAGLDGIEVYYPCHYSEHIRLFSNLAKELNLLITCGGDYHNDYDRTKNTMGFDADLPGLSKSVEILLAGERD